MESQYVFPRESVEDVCTCHSEKTGCKGHESFTDRGKPTWDESGGRTVQCASSVRCKGTCLPSASLSTSQVIISFPTYDPALAWPTLFLLTGLTSFCSSGAFFPVHNCCEVLADGPDYLHQCLLFYVWMIQLGGYSF